jgi:hypothetical protein
MALQTISISAEVKTELEAKQLKTAFESIAKSFKPAELVIIAKKMEMTMVRMKIRSMI